MERDSRVGAAHRNSARRTICRQLVATRWLPLKESAPMLHEFLQSRFGSKIALIFGNAVFQSGVFLFKCSYTLLHCVSMFTEKSEPLPHNLG